MREKENKPNSINSYPPQLLNTRKRGIKNINPDTSHNFSKRTISLIPCFLYQTTGQFKGIYLCNRCKVRLASILFINSEFHIVLFCRAYIKQVQCVQCFQLSCPTLLWFQFRVYQSVWSVLSLVVYVKERHFVLYPKQFN